MIRIGGKQREESRGRVRRVAYRDVQFIRGHHFQRRISILPPELVPDHGDFNGVAWPGGVLDAGDYARCRQEQDHNNEDRNDRPREFHLSASVNLRRLAPVARPLSS